MNTHPNTASNSMKKSLSRGSESSTQFESPHHFSSPTLWVPESTESPEYRSPQNSPGVWVDNSLAVVPVKKSAPGPGKASERQKPPENAASAAVTVFNPTTTREEPQRPATKVGERRSRSAPAGWKAEEVVRKVALGFRLSEVAVCLISFSVMAADRTQGWSGDSYDRYKEYRYCLCMNVIGFAHSGLQACDLACQLVTGKHIISHHLRYHFDFFMDQVLAYLLISASSSAATRVDDWQSNWGKDEFTEMATVSVGMSFLAFAAFAMSSLISGYILCTRSSM
ncbi:CASP-like protein 4A3 [Lotus japonicus]|uniref:CASP-like protein 4A3 n=1 Tax=Lotus japonicus TaxID=34305 RepID=UPI0025874B9E|nr:CASP-like protein 4A3 [Lotus japonicus]